MSYSWACEVSTEDVDRTLSNSGDDAAEAASFVLELFTPDDIFSLDVEAAEPLFAAFAGVPEVLVPDVLLADVLAPVVVRFEAAPVAPFAVGALAEEADFFAFVEVVEADLAGVSFAALLAAVLFAGVVFAVEDLDVEVLFAEAGFADVVSFLAVLAVDEVVVAPALGFRRREDCIEAAGSVRAARAAFCSSVPCLPSSGSP
ncbi:MAG: hypothetical protein ACTH3R_14350, partial [Brevibacterium aurantiacum]|uniref:hypothetical protein n=1 Tax=Brevibacterium aurantiacum TaxID=273384 RepID=UPI003F8E01DB